MPDNTKYVALVLFYVSRADDHHKNKELNFVVKGDSVSGYFFTQLVDEFMLSQKPERSYISKRDIIYKFAELIKQDEQIYLQGKSSLSVLEFTIATIPDEIVAIHDVYKQRRYIIKRHAVPATEMVSLQSEFEDILTRLVGFCPEE